MARFMSCLSLFMALGGTSEGMAPKSGNWLGGLPGAALSRNPIVSPPATALVSQWISLSDRWSLFVYARQLGRAIPVLELRATGGGWPGGAGQSPAPRWGRAKHRLKGTEKSRNFCHGWWGHLA